MTNPNQIKLLELPRFECLRGVANRFPELNPKAMEGFLNLVITMEKVTQAAHTHFARHGISKGRFLVMIFLSERVTGCNRAFTPAELADQAGCTRATMTGLVDSLEKDGFVLRVPDAEDRRMMRISLSPKGEEFLAGFLPGHLERINKMMSGISDIEIDTLIGLLRKITAMCGEEGPLGSDVTQPHQEC